jgi:uncharacterized protein
MTQSLKAKLFFLLAVGAVVGAWAQMQIPNKPTKQTELYDYADVLDRNEERALIQKIVQYADAT